MTTDADNQKNGSSCEVGGSCCCSGPGKWIWLVLILAIAGVLIAKNAWKKETQAVNQDVPGPTTGLVATNSSPAVEKALPKLVDLGAGKCIPCKKMAPILEELKKDYEGRMDVKFIDVWENPDAKKEYGIMLIPTQIFYDAQGKELFRHEGFFSKDDILSKWKELGVDIGEK